MSFVHNLTRPYYLCRPSQILRRVRFEFQKPARPRWVELPWGLRMMANPGDDFGYSLQTTGINDLMVSECLFRLTDPGELAVDVGANIGYTTGILSVRAGEAGRVVSFEPHPALYQELRSNLDAWKQQRADLAEVKAVNSAVSDRTGEAALYEPASFDSNRGRSMLGVRHDNGEASRELRVPTVALDEHFAGGESIGVLKVDVEGHEEQVFAGAKNLLSTGRVRDALLEEYKPYPAKTHRMLEEAGFQIFVVDERPGGPALISPKEGWIAPVSSPTNYVATRDVNRLRRKFEPRGWHCLSGKGKVAAA